MQFLGILAERLAAGINGDAKAVKKYLETMIPPEICALTDVRPTANSGHLHRVLHRRRSENGENGDHRVLRRPLRRYRQHERHRRPAAACERNELKLAMRKSALEIRVLRSGACVNQP